MGVKSIRALERGLAVLDALAREGPMTLQGLAEETGLSKATLSRLLLTLEAAGYARRGLGDRLWRANMRPGQPSGDQTAIVLAEVAGPILDRLCQEILWPSDIGVYAEGAIRVLETSRLVSPFVVNQDVLTSRVHVLPSAMGRAILGWADDATRTYMLGQLSLSDDPQDLPSRDPARVAAMITEARSQGYATRNPGYFIRSRREPAMRAIAVPVIVEERLVGAINLTWIHSAGSETAFIRQHLCRLETAAGDIAQAFASRLKQSSR